MPSGPPAAAGVEEAGVSPALALESLLAGIREQGFGLVDNFVDHKTVVRLRTCADLRAIRGEFKPAAIGAARSRQQRNDIRGDQTCWLREPLFPAESEARQKLEKIRLGINQELMLGLFDLETHYALYPPGAAYARHVDQPADSDARRLTFALYLNLEWDANAGGELRLYDAGQAVADIEPRGGRLVCFLTAGREHEVLPAKRARMSLTGWFRTRA
jgi:SM-20-related protein